MGLYIIWQEESPVVVVLGKHVKLLNAVAFMLVEQKDNSVERSVILKDVFLSFRIIIIILYYYNMNNIKHVNNGSSYEVNGWKFISIKGAPKERGYAYGSLIATELKQIFDMVKYTTYDDTGETWEYFIDAAVKLYKQKIIENFPEIYEEMEGIAEGCSAAGFKVSSDEILTWNNYIALTGYWYPNKDGSSGRKAGGLEGGGSNRNGGGSDRCSAFIAVGSYTADKQIVVAHNNFDNFTSGQYINMVVDIKPENGHRILMQTTAGLIWSATDFFVTSAGIIGTETTIGGFLPFENNFPISCRIRKAMQYGDNMDDYVKILLDGNSGDYANAWLFGDINTNEILRLELGLKFHNVERTKDGYFIGFNATYDPRIRNQECTNSGFNDVRRHQGARKVRLEELMVEYKGKLDVDVAKMLIADHYDVYLKKDDLPCSRTVCSHYDLDAREYMSQADRPLPYQPRGATDGCVADSAMIKGMSVVGRYGNSCGIPFDKNKFCDEHIQWAHLRPYLLDRPTQPWTVFKTMDIKTHVAKKHTKKINTESKGGKRKKTRKLTAASLLWH